MRGRGARVMRNHREPAQVPAMRRDHLGIGRLGDRGDRAAMTGEIFHLRRRRAGVGGDRDGAEFDAGEPGQHRLDAIVEMDQDVFAGPDAAFDEARGQRADTRREIRRSSSAAPAHRTAPRSGTDGRGASRRASAAARARPSRRTVRPCPAPVKFVIDPPVQLGCLAALLGVLLPSDAAVGKSRSRHPGCASCAPQTPKPSTIFDASPAEMQVTARLAPQDDVGMCSRRHSSSYDEISIRLPSGSRQ